MEFDPRTVQPVASRYTDCTISAHYLRQMPRLSMKRAMLPQHGFHGNNFAFSFTYLLKWWTILDFVYHLFYLKEHTDSWLNCIPLSIMEKFVQATESGPQDWANIYLQILTW
jgi:hypothetical protein